MTKILLLFTLFTTQLDTTGKGLFAQDSLSVSMLKPHTSYFELKGNEFNGADALLQEAKNAQFVALGEIHNSRKLSQFTSALMHHLKSQSNSNLIVETGPYSAMKLEQLIYSTDGRNQVTDFYKMYSSKIFQYYVIPFFTGKGDLDMLQQAQELNYNIIGIDQEYYYSVIYLSDELKKLSDEPLTPRQDRLLSKIKSKLTWWYRRSSIFSGFDMSCHIRNYGPFVDYISSFREANDSQKMIIKAMNISLEIYCLNESGNWSEGNKKRIEYFKHNFDSWYRWKQEKLGITSRQYPKAIIKMGSYHSGRSRSPVGVYDIGNHIAQLTESLGTESLHLRFLNRYFDDGRDVIDDENWSASKKFIFLAKRDKWTLIDTRVLRKQILGGRLVGNQFEIREILNYDYIIIMPEDKRATKHY